MKRDEFAQSVSAYLARFPDEQAALSDLSRQLREDETDMLSRANMRGHLTASAFVLNAERNAVLFIHHKAHNMWLQPGGHYEAPGDLWDTARREVAEETGIQDIALHEWHHQHAIPFDIDTHHVPARPAKNEGDHVHHDVMYIAVAGSNAAGELQASEITGLRWVPLAELATMPGLRLARFLPKLKREGIL